MKYLEFTGRLVGYERLNCSTYGNPAYYGCFQSEDGDSLMGRTTSNASCAYGFLNEREKPRKIRYHITKSGKIHFDYIDIIH